MTAPPTPAMMANKSSKVRFRQPRLYTNLLPLIKQLDANTESNTTSQKI